MKKKAAGSLYHQLPETLETQRVREVTELQSQVRTKAHFIRRMMMSEAGFGGDGGCEAGSALADRCSLGPRQPLCFLQNKYKQSGKTSTLSSLYAQLPQTAETQLAAKMAALQSEVRPGCP